MTDSQKDLVLHFLREGDWAEAIAFYREETGSDPETAELAVRRLASRHGIRPLGQLRSLLMLTCILSVLVVAWWIQSTM